MSQVPCPECGWMLESPRSRSRLLQCARCRTMLVWEKGKLAVPGVHCPSCRALVGARDAVCPECGVALSLDD